MSGWMGMVVQIVAPAVAAVVIDRAWQHRQEVRDTVSRRIKGVKP